MITDSQVNLALGLLHKSRAIDTMVVATGHIFPIFDLIVVEWLKTNHLTAKILKLLPQTQRQPRYCFRVCALLLDWTAD